MVRTTEMHKFRSLAFGLFFALIGASYAIATNSDASARGFSAADRSVGSNLRFSTPFLLPGQDSTFPAGGDVAADPDGFDLGDICAGTQVVRHITALGGVQPYLFTSTDVGTGGSAGLTLENTGRVRGMLTVGTQTPAFNGRVIDAAGVSRTGVFRFTFVPCIFRFAHDRLPAAQVGLDYITNTAVIGGNGQETFSVVAGTASLNGTALTNFEDSGLRLFGDGTIAGRPLQSGTLTFTARAAMGSSVARNRADTQNDQPFTLTINAQTTIQSLLASTKASIRGDFARDNKDTFELQARINVDGLNAQDFANQVVTVRFLGATFSTQLDSAGQAKTGDMRVGLKLPKGELRIVMKKVTLGGLLDQATLKDRSTKIAVVQVQIGSNFLSTEPIEFATQNRSNKFKMAYALGKQRQIGGLFQINRLDGLEFSNGTAFRMFFFISPVNGGLGSATSATVAIGQNFSETKQLFGGQGVFAPDGIRKIKLNRKKLLGEIQTYELSAAESGVARPSDAGGQQQTFLLGLHLETGTTDFDGEASRQIMPFVVR